MRAPSAGSARAGAATTIGGVAPISAVAFGEAHYLGGGRGSIAACHFN
jgi:hypothetical protein